MARRAEFSVLVIFIVSLTADDKITSTEHDLLFIDENITYSSFVTEINDDNVTNEVSSTELYMNETFNDTKLLPAPKPVKPKIKYDKQTDNNIEFCLCDLQLDYCDINCCCDTNCTQAQKSTFSDCEIYPQHEDPNYCYATEILYINRTKIFREIPENRLFCIVKSNLPSYHIVQLTQPIKSTKKLDYLISRHNKWPKPIQTIDNGKIDPKDISPKYGYNIWLQTADTELVPLMLPDKFTSNMCAQKKPVHFLEDFKSSCAHKFIDESNPVLNAETYYKNVNILSLPKSTNFSLSDFYGGDCPKNNCLPINAFLCDESLTKCDFIKNDTETKLVCHFSTFRNEQSCLFVAQKIRYNFFHNASSELTIVNLYLFLTNVTYFLGDSLEFIQHFEVNFFWEGYKQNFSSVLSGNPGYLSGKYILFGELIINNSSNATLQYIISQNYTDLKTNFLVFPKNVDGFCTLNNEQYYAIIFGYNIKSSCIFLHEANLTENATFLCQNLQKQIFQLWQINLTRQYESSGKFVGMFGNSNRWRISEWTEIVYKFQESKILEKITGELKNDNLICRNIAQILSVDIIYAYVDFKFTKHQAKILNVFYETYLTNFFSTKCSFDENKQNCLLKMDLETEVMFYDFSESKIKEFAKPPSLQISLPLDFFYPFMMGSQVITTCNFNLLQLSLYALIVFY